MKFCALCAAAGVKTPSEQYRNIELDYCTFHYWLIHGRYGSGREYSLEEYVNASRKFAFRISLPSQADRTRMQDEHRGVSGGASKPTVNVAPKRK